MKSVHFKYGVILICFYFYSGYMAPEYASYGIVSVKIDIFSFGVLLLEIVSGRKNNSFYKPDEQPVTLIGYVSFIQFNFTVKEDIYIQDITIIV